MARIKKKRKEKYPEQVAENSMVQFDRNSGAMLVAFVFLMIALGVCRNT